jgi:preprotein translocase subunit SecG
VIFFIVVFALGLITAKQDQAVEESTMQKATRENAAEQAPEMPVLPATFNAPAEAAPAAPAAAEVKAEAPAAPAAEVKAEAAPAPEAAAPAEAPKAKKGKKKAK